MASNLNGLNFNTNNAVSEEGIVWYTWRDYHFSLSSAEMAIRPKSYEPFNP